MITLKDKKYKSVADASKKLGIPYQTLKYRIKKYGANSDLLFLTSHELNKYIHRHMTYHVLIVNGIKYNSLCDYCRKIGVTTDCARKRFAKYGYNHPILNYGGHAIKINGQWYNNIREAAKLHHLNVNTLNTRLFNYGYNSPKVFQRLKIKNDNLSNHQANLIKIIHEKGLLTQKEVATKTGLPLTLLHHAVIDSNSNNKYGGIKLTDIVNLKIKNVKMSAFKPSVIAHVISYRNNMPNLKIIPQTNNQYLWDEKNQNVYSINSHATGNFKKMKIRYRPNFTGWLLRISNKAVKFTKSQIYDLFDYPCLTSSNLVTRDQIKATFNLSQGQFYRYKLNQILKLHKRFDFKSKNAIYGYAKADLPIVKQAIKNNKKAQTKKN